MNCTRMMTFTASAATMPTGAVRFAGIAYSGGLIPQWNAIIDLAHVRVAEHMPIMLAHRSESVVGVAEQVVNDGASLRITGRIHADIDPEAAAVVAKAARGTRWEMSIGLYDTSERTLLAGRSERINGREFSGPLVILAGHIREASIVALGADPATSARFFDAAHTPVVREVRGALIADAERRAAEVAVTRGAWR